MKMTYSANGQIYPRWVFNDVPVKPGGQSHFIAWVTTSRRSLLSPFTTIWTHAADARTYLPAPEPPPSCVP